MSFKDKVKTILQGNLFFLLYMALLFGGLYAVTFISNPILGILAVILLLNILLLVAHHLINTFVDAVSRRQRRKREDDLRKRYFNE